MKSQLKSAVQALAVVAVSPVVVIDLLLRRFDSDGAFTACTQLLSLFPGKLGSYLRVAYLRIAAASCHPECFVGFTTLFSHRKTRIGRGVYIGPQCNIGLCRIDSDSLIASGVHIMSGTDQHSFESLDTPIRDQGGTFNSISIGRDCWIGNAAVVMADIGDQSIIGAGSVVTRPIPARSIAVGNPARVIRSRDTNEKTDS